MVSVAFNRISQICCIVLLYCACVSCEIVLFFQDEVWKQISVSTQQLIQITVNIYAVVASNIFLYQLCSMATRAQKKRQTTSISAIIPAPPFPPQSINPQPRPTSKLTFSYIYIFYQASKRRRLEKRADGAREAVTVVFAPASAPQQRSMAGLHRDP